MADHYFTSEPRTPSRPIEIEVAVRGLRLTLHSDAGIFSGRRLDAGTKLLIEAAEFGRGESVLDLGCGYGVVAIAAAHLTAGPLFLIDINARAARCAAENVRRYGLTDRALVLVADGVGALEPGSVERVLCNPPIRAGRAVVERLVAGAVEVLASCGSFALVARTRQGAESLRRVLQARFEHVETVARGGGYRVLLGCEPRPIADAADRAQSPGGPPAGKSEARVPVAGSGSRDRSSTGE